MRLGINKHGRYYSKGIQIPIPLQREIFNSNLSSTRLSKLYGLSPTNILKYKKETKFSKVGRPPLNSKLRNEKIINEISIYVQHHPFGNNSQLENYLFTTTKVHTTLSNICKLRKLAKIRRRRIVSTPYQQSTLRIKKLRL